MQLALRHQDTTTEWPKSHWTPPCSPPERASPNAFPAAFPLLDNYHQNCTLGVIYCQLCRNAKKRRGRAYHRVLTGVRLPGRWQMWTLTTSPEAVSAGKNIQASFRALVMRLRRRGLCSGYLRVVEYTKAGQPHLHVLIRGRPIPHWWLSEVWGQIHLSTVVWYSKIRTGRGAGAYLGKYLGKDPRARYSWSWDWVWKGFVGDWRKLCRSCFDSGLSMVDIIEIWRAILDQYGARWPKPG